MKYNSYWSISYILTYFGFEIFGQASVSNILIFSHNFLTLEPSFEWYSLGTSWFPKMVELENLYIFILNCVDISKSCFAFLNKYYQTFSKNARKLKVILAIHFCLMVTLMSLVIFFDNCKYQNKNGLHKTSYKIFSYQVIRIKT